MEFVWRLGWLVRGECGCRKVKGLFQGELRWPRCGDLGSRTRRSVQGEVSRDRGKGVTVLRRGVPTAWRCGGQAGAGFTAPTQRPYPNP